MMRLLIPVILLIVGLGGGVGAGLMLAGDPEPVAEDEAAEPSDEEGYGEEGEGDSAEADEGYGGDEASPDPEGGDGTEFVRLNNQFVVPIVRNGAVRSLVVLSLSIEVNTGQNTNVFDREPRLRDSFLRVLFAHANAGGFDGSFTEAAAMTPLREALREAAVGILGRSVAYDVLITDITRQDA